MNTSMTEKKRNSFCFVVSVKAALSTVLIQKGVLWRKMA